MSKGPAAQLLKKLAEKWQDGGRRSEDLVSDEYSMTAYYCWRGSTGAKNEGVDPLVDEYISASFDAMGGKKWYDRYLCTRFRCSGCFETYRLENLTLCTHCRTKGCYRCRGFGAKHPNGNTLCGCGGEEVG